MKKLTSIPALVLLAILLLSLTTGCKKGSSISACIGNIPTIASVGVPVSFTSCTSGASAYLWNFGDTMTASGQTVSHTYASAGTFTGTLTVSENSGSAYKNFTITLVPNTWTFNNTVFVTDSVLTSASGADITAVGKTGDTTVDMDLIFSSLPTASGHYTVVNAAANNVQAGQVYVILYSYTSGGETIFGSTGSGNVQAQVTLSGGRMSVTLPSIEVVNQSLPADSLILSATNITQIQ